MKEFFPPRFCKAFVLGFTVVVSFCSPWSSRSFAEEAPAAPALPVLRLSRAFFEKPVHAELKLVRSTGEVSEYKSPVAWVEYPPVAPANAPTSGQVLGDFRDFVACAYFTEISQSRLCFKVMGDVSNLGLNDREMALRGIETISVAQRDPKCTAFQLQKAALSADSVDLDFKGADGCGSSVQLTLISEM